MQGKQEPRRESDQEPNRQRSPQQQQQQLPQQQPSIVVPPPPPSDFSIFVRQSIGYTLPIFGETLFDRVPTTFAPITSAPPPGSYVIGPGDRLIVRTWGLVEFNNEVQVDRSGQIFLPKVGVLRVAGLRFDELQGFLKTAIGKNFQNFDVSVTMASLRSIQVLVVGQALRPGSYTVSSLSTLVNTLFASGGPSSKGSMRHIQLKRGAVSIGEFDFYDLLTRGDTSKDVVLQSGDVIFIPPVGPQVAIAGSVNTPAIYELKSSKESLEQLLSEAGGLTNVANTESISLERISDRKVRSITDAPLSRISQEELRDGDILVIRKLGARYDNAVTIRGNVSVPGRFPWHDGMRIHDLIPSREALVSEVYWQHLADQGQLKTTGERQMVHLSDVNWDYAVVERLDKENLSADLIPFNLAKAISGDPGEDKVLQPNDVVTIFSQSEMTVPRSRATRWVRIDGEVKGAGLYRVESGDTLQTVIQRAGGLTTDAFLFGSELTREAARQVQQQQLDGLITKLQTTALRQPTGTKDSADYLVTIQERNKVIDRMRLLRATGRIVLELKPSDADVNGLPPLKLQDGDHLYIPARPDFVTLVGSVNQVGSVIYSQDQRVGDYLRRAGGVTADADKAHSFVIRANGSVVSSRNELFTSGIESVKAYPGDTIVVVPRLRDRLLIDNIKDWSQVLGNFGLAAAAINVLK